MAIADMIFVSLFLIGCAVTGWHTGKAWWPKKPEPVNVWPRKPN